MVEYIDIFSQVRKLELINFDIINRDFIGPCINCIHR